MTQDEEVYPYASFWAAWRNTTEDNQKSTFAQVMNRVKELSMPAVVGVVDGAPMYVKQFIWAVWAKMADLSGLALTDILEAEATEPPSAMYSIIERWLAQVDLSKYDLAQIRKSTTMLRGKDIGKLWQRWLSSADLSTVNLIELAKSIAGLSPDLQLMCLNGYALHCPNVNMYGRHEKEAALKYLARWAVYQCPLFQGAVPNHAPKFKVGHSVRVNGAYWDRVQSVRLQNGAYYYWLRDGMRYYAETELTGM